MKKIAGLYQSYLRERNDEIQEISTGGEKMEKLTAFLKEKLNADDYFTAEELPLFLQGLSFMVHSFFIFSNFLLHKQ